jgi:hypothetical protein
LDLDPHCASRYVVVTDSADLADWPALSDDEIVIISVDVVMPARSTTLFLYCLKGPFDQAPDSFGACRWGVQSGNPLFQRGNLMLVQAHEDAFPTTGCLWPASFFRDIPY